MRVAPGGPRAGAGVGFGAAHQPPEALLGEDLPDPGAVERGRLGAQPGADLMDRQALVAQLHHPGPGAVLGRGALRAGPRGRGEHLHLARAEVAQQAGHARAGVADTGASLGDADPLHEVRPQPLLPALVELGGRGEELALRGPVPLSRP